MIKDSMKVHSLKLMNKGLQCKEEEDSVSIKSLNLMTLLMLFLSLKPYLGMILEKKTKLQILVEFQTYSLMHKFIRKPFIISSSINQSLTSNKG